MRSKNQYPKKLPLKRTTIANLQGLDTKNVKAGHDTTGTETCHVSFDEISDCCGTATEYAAGCETDNGCLQIGNVEEKDAF